MRQVINPAPTKHPDPQKGSGCLLSICRCPLTCGRMPLPPMSPGTVPGDIEDATGRWARAILMEVRRALSRWHPRLGVATRRGSQSEVETARRDFAAAKLADANRRALAHLPTNLALNRPATSAGSGRVIPEAPVIRVEQHGTSGRRTVVLIVGCPYCCREHAHGGGRDLVTAHQFLGHRAAHCAGQAPASRGYMLVDPDDLLGGAS